MEHFVLLAAEKFLGDQEQDWGPTRELNLAGRLSATQRSLLFGLAIREFVVAVLVLFPVFVILLTVLFGIVPIALDPLAILVQLVGIGLLVFAFLLLWTGFDDAIDGLTGRLIVRTGRMRKRGESVPGPLRCYCYTPRGQRIVRAEPLTAVPNNPETGEVK